MYNMRRSAVNYQSGLIKIHHISALTVKKLFVKKVSGSTILREWKNENKGVIQQDDIYYVECTRKGIINWTDTTIYTADELVARENVFVVTGI